MYPRYPAFYRWRERMENLPTTQKLRAALPPRGPILHAREWAIRIAQNTQLAKAEPSESCVQRPRTSLYCSLFNLATAVDDEGHLLAVFHRPDGDTLAVDLMSRICE